ncbi:hypothetical protein [Streptomyces sp. NPDC049881]|uniref:hypothetical protein n=1 Tax=Streptomyces sp. NPDC049881 TaxID=3155778 RepID=UPI00343FE1D9
MAEYVAGCRRRPPEDVLGLLGRRVRSLLEEGFTPGDLRVALVRLREKGLHPSVLPSLVNQVVNGAAPSTGGGGLWGSTAASHTPYVNAASEPTTFGGGL